MTKLFEPFVLGNLTLKNRIIMAGMHTEFGRDGYLTERELAYYEERAKGGAAAIGVVARVSPEGGPESMAGVYDNTFGAGVRCLAERLHQHDCRLFIHLFHIGRNHADDILGRPLLAPSAVPSPIYRHMPKEMTAKDIKRVKEDFADAAARCRAWGADGVTVNCSAGYLLSLFLSGETNQRTDEYGGSQENRFRFPLEVLARVREAVGRDFPVLVKISGSSMRARGYGLKDMEAFSSKLSGLADAIGVTGGWHEAPVPQITYQVPRGFYSCLSSCIKEHSGLPVICYNRINDRETAERILEEEKADLVACGRPFLADAGFAAKIRNGHPYHPCVGCNRGCMDRIIRNQEVRCIQNPELGSEYQKLSSLPAREGRVLVIGGGVAGMAAARFLEKRGYQVTLKEKKGRLGGVLDQAAASPGKEGFLGIAAALEWDLKALGTHIVTDAVVTAEGLKAEADQYSFVVLATGGKPRRMKGGTDAGIYLAQEVIQGDYRLWNRMNCNQTVIIGGDAAAMETALFLAGKRWLEDSHQGFMERYVPDEVKERFLPSGTITLIEKEERAGRNLGGTRFIIMNELKQNHIKVMTGTRVVETGDGYVIVQKGDSRERLCADFIIEAMGEEPEQALASVLEEMQKEFYVVGDASVTADIEAAIRGAYELARSV